MDCFESLVTSNLEASRIAIELGARAMTDVTGFGLVGHLGTMLRSSGTSAILDVTALPALPGALELLAQGFRSTFHPENAKARKGLVTQLTAAEDPRFELLFDPQTSGGLLFGVETRKVDEALSRLDRASVIGEVRPRRADGALIEVVAHRTSKTLESSESGAPVTGSRNRQPSA
jgi:selenide,water dikinase